MGIQRNIDEATDTPQPRETHRLVDTNLNDGDLSEQAEEVSLRPTTFADYIGQERLKTNLKLAIDAVKKRNDGTVLDHVLLYGPPGLGKTTMANVIAHEMGANLRVTSGPAIERAGDLASILTNLQDGDVLFIDEIHRLRRAVEEILYSAMEDCKLDIVIGKGPAARSVRLDLPKFTVIGATTRTGSLAGISEICIHGAADEKQTLQMPEEIYENRQTEIFEEPAIHQDGRTIPAGTAGNFTLPDPGRERVSAFKEPAKKEQAA